MDDQSKTLEGLKQQMRDDRNRNRQAAANDVNRNIYIASRPLDVAACNSPGRQSEILEKAISKVQAIPELAKFNRMADPNKALMYRLPKGVKNPISGDDAEFEGKVTVDLVVKSTYLDSLLAARFKAESGLDIKTADVGRFLGQDF
ncbi:hypothetical protein LTR56_007350 [Elasticomyces elasticus]|nr:hypothetical protein LTR22_019658 [Elasticomyces elasticus]KAK3648527.1 hypothetical protein LTR56_007350 [Elasticomyces elasticus]KAK4930465.1 hypothetical protein LTR49_002873 [Elasticomyces elasticus]KAK5745061.1 hypothetical protein LTS12_023253 [Elasticomyces elasticus]